MLELDTRALGLIVVSTAAASVVAWGGLALKEPEARPAPVLETPMLVTHELPTAGKITGLWMGLDGEVWAYGQGVALRWDGQRWIDTHLGSHWTVKQMTVGSNGLPRAEVVFYDRHICCVMREHGGGGVPCGESIELRTLAFDGQGWVELAHPGLSWNPDALGRVSASNTRLTREAVHALAEAIGGGWPNRFQAAWQLGDETWAVGEEGHAVARFRGLERTLFIASSSN